MIILVINHYWRPRNNPLPLFVSNTWCIIANLILLRQRKNDYVDNVFLIQEFTAYHVLYPHIHILALYPTPSSYKIRPTEHLQVGFVEF